MTRLCIDVTFHVRATEIIDDGIEAGEFEIPPAVIDYAKRRVQSIITNDDPSVSCDVACNVYRSEVVKLNDATKA